MNAKSMLVLGLCLITCCLILGRSLGDTPAKPQAEQMIAGRYQVMTGTHGATGDFHFVLVDSATGHCWLKKFRFTGDNDGIWQDQGSPAEKHGKK